MKFGIIGNETVAIRCLQHILHYPDAQIKFFIYDPNRENKRGAILRFCEQHAIRSVPCENLNDPVLIDIAVEACPDMILSISNYWILSREWLIVPCKGVINFHNAPPSRYHGINIPSWVILNGEKEHGVMWHYVEERIDTGDAIASKKFQISEEETAGSLMLKCIQHGITLFQECFQDLLNNRVRRYKQADNAEYYSLRDMPENRGVLDFNWNGEKICRMVRGLNYLPYRNHFCYAMIKTSLGKAVVNQAIFKPIKTSCASGTILGIEDNHIQIACQNGCIVITSFMDVNQVELEPRKVGVMLGITVGSRIDPPKLD